MHFSVSPLLVVLALTRHALGQFDTTTTVIQNTPVWVPVAGGAATSRIAAPLATPTLIYNCAQMPLICENVASWARDEFPQNNGDLPGNQLFHFDPNERAKNRRRTHTCDDFAHDTCPQQISNGKQLGISVPQVAFNAFGAAPPISGTSQAIILAGLNPSTLNNPNAQRIPLNAIPPRFYGQGILYSCDGASLSVIVSG